MNQNRNYFKYWGKASKPKDKGKEIKDAPVQYHLLVYHCLDVAAVADCLLASEQLNYLEPLAKQLKVKPNWLRKWLVFCIALHDLGKFFRSFQNLNCNDIKELVTEIPKYEYTIKHDALGMLLYRDIKNNLASIFPSTVLRRKISKWLEIVCSHHGQPVALNKDETIANHLIENEDDLAAKNFIIDIYNLFFNNEDINIITQIDSKDFKKSSWQIAGICTLADWLGSNQDFFVYKQQPIPLEQYWHKHALPAAKKAVTNIDIKKTVAPFNSIKDQFPFIDQLTPLQQYVTDIQLTNEPQLIILEDVMGAGKTEAAMVLVHKLLSQKLGRGLYIGLPTMATSNAMYSRMQKSYEALFTTDKVSLVLAHSASALSEKFQQTISDIEQPTDANYQQQEHTASAYCNSWFTDNRKKALLADIGVGTIDQALMAVLPVKYQSLRMLGLHNKILLLDEIHAYDTYTSEILIALLKMHQRNGGSAIILSATLQQEFKEKLIAIYNNNSIEMQSDYPLATSVSTNNTTQQPIATREMVKRQTKITKLDSTQQCIDKIKQAVKQGQCVCWIRNTVADATEVYQQLQQDNEIDNQKLTLFHSRFTMADRQKIEDKVLKIFGKESTAKERQGQILIATQVVEQSLDLDFDILITDLAPIDLIIQRIGRLKRHVRDALGNPIKDNNQDQRPPAELYVLMPDPNEVKNKNWLKALLDKTEYVYQDTSIMWQTAKQLINNGTISMPDDARELIEAVYCQDYNQIPEPLQSSADNATGNTSANKNYADSKTLKLCNGYTKASSENWHDDSIISTRVSEVETCTIILVKLHNDELQFYKWQDNKAKSMLLSQLSIPYHYWEQAQQYISDIMQAKIEEFKIKYKLKEFHNVFPLVDETLDLYNNKTGWLSIK